MQKQAKLLTPQQATKKQRRVPAAWKKAAGLLKGRKKSSSLSYQRESRRAWQLRLAKLLK